MEWKTDSVIPVTDERANDIVIDYRAHVHYQPILSVCFHLNSGSNESSIDRIHISLELSYSALVRFKFMS